MRLRCKHFILTWVFFLFFSKLQSQLFAGGPIFPFHVLQYTFHGLQCTSHDLQYTFHDLQLNFGVKVKIKIRPSKYFQMEFSDYSHSSIAFVELFCCNYISGKTPKTRLNALILRRMRVKPRLQQILRKICTPLAH